MAGWQSRQCSHCPQFSHSATMTAVWEKGEKGSGKGVGKRGKRGQPGKRGKGEKGSAWGKGEKGSGKRGQPGKRGKGVSLNWEKWEKGSGKGEKEGKREGKRGKRGQPELSDFPETRASAAALPGIGPGVNAASSRDPRLSRGTTRY